MSGSPHQQMRPLYSILVIRSSIGTKKNPIQYNPIPYTETHALGRKEKSNQICQIGIVNVNQKKFIQQLNNQINRTRERKKNRIAQRKRNFSQISGSHS